MERNKSETDGQDENRVIGRHIRLLRQSQHRTLEDVATQCGFSKSLLSKIERGRLIPSVGTLVKIARAMGTSIAALVEREHENQGPVYTPRESARAGLIETGKGIRIFPFATEHSNNRVQPFLYVARRGQTKAHNDSHEGQEFIFVIRGMLQVRVGHVQYNLREGDSLYFDAMDDHECTPISEEVEYLDVFA